MIQAGFIFLTVALTAVLLRGNWLIARKTYSEKLQRRRATSGTAILLLAWLAYVSLISMTGIFTNPSFPPRIPLLLVFPAFGFFVYFFAGRRFKPVIENVPVSWPVYFQSFRVIVELLIWGCVIKGVLPKAASFEGYNFDIVIGITAPLFAYFFAGKNREINRGMLIAWNIGGLATLAIVVFIIMSRAYFYSRLGLPEGILAQGFGRFPYTFLAGFFMPLAVFMHVLSLRRTLQSK